MKMIVESLELIEDLINQENYSQVTDNLEQLIEADPENLNHYWYLGLVYLLQENEELAQEIWLSILLQGTIKEVEQWTSELIDFLENQVRKNIDQNKLGNAKIIYDTISLFKYDYNNEEIVNNLVKEICLFGSRLSFQGEYKEAINIYHQALDINPEYDVAWHALALSYYYLENYANAKDAIDKAIILNRNCTENYNLLGLILEKQDKIQDAISTYEIVMNINPKCLRSYKSLIRIYQNQEPQNSAKIISICNKALDIYFQDIYFHNHLVLAYRANGNLGMANLHYGYAWYYSNNTGSLFNALEYFEKYYQSKSFEANNKNVGFKFYGVMANCYAMCNQTDKAIALIEKALIIFSEKKLEIKRLNQCILPILYSTTEEIEFYRQRFCTLLDDLIAETSFETAEEKADTLNSISTKTNFYLSYQNRNDVDVLKKFGEHVHSIMRKSRPELCRQIPVKLCISQRRIRIGIASYRLGGLGLLYLGWIKCLNKDYFEIFIYNFVENSEASLCELKKYFDYYSDHFKTLFFSQEWDEIYSSILDDNLDILIYPDFGIDAVFNLLAYTRLAPVQCTTWGHPVTSGSPTIDYFLSSDLMEPPNADEHYTEKLVRLPNLGFSLLPVTLPEQDKVRGDFGLEEEKIVYLCSQSLFKYLPQHDFIFSSIALHSPNFQFVFVAPLHGEVITQCFKKRLEQAFTQFGLQCKDYCVFLPRLSNNDFMKLNQLSDIFLDCLSWSGGLTTRQALACGLPVVTRPGEFMRGRHSYAMLKMINITETIAKDEEEYIKIAVDLGLDKKLRQDIRLKTLQNLKFLFDDKECISALEKFFQETLSS